MVSKVQKAPKILFGSGSDVVVKSRLNKRPVLGPGGRISNRDRANVGQAGSRRGR